MDIKKTVISVLKKFEGKISGKFVVITSKKNTHKKYLILKFFSSGTEVDNLTVLLSFK